MSELESRFTAPSDFCPHPEYWHSADSDSTEDEVIELIAAFVRALQPEIVVETGTAFAFGTQAIGEALQRNGHGKLYSLEVDDQRVADAKIKVAGLPVEIVHMPSLEWTPPGEIGFAFFDSLTHLRGQEFLRYKPWLPKGTIVAFHDAGPQHIVYPIIEDLAFDGYIRDIRLHTPRGVAFCEVI